MLLLHLLGECKSVPSVVIDQKLVTPNDGSSIYCRPGIRIWGDSNSADYESAMTAST